MALSEDLIRLDAHTLADAEAHVAGEDHEMRLRFEAPDPDNPATMDHFRDVLRKWIAAHAAGAPTIVYAVRRLSGELIGGAEIRRPTPACVDVSYWIYPAYRGRGYATRALVLLCRIAASTPGVGQVEAHIDPDNLASRRTAEAAGFLELGLVEERWRSGAVGARVRYARLMAPNAD